MLIQLQSHQTPVNLRTPLLVDDLGLPRYWSTIWSIFSSAQLAESTHIKKLRYIEDLYRHADDCFGRSASIEAIKARPSSSVGWQNQLSHAMQRLDGVQTLLATPPGHAAFPNGADLSHIDSLGILDD